MLLRVCEAKALGLASRREGKAGSVTEPSDMTFKRWHWDCRIEFRFVCDTTRPGTSEASEEPGQSNRQGLTASQLKIMNHYGFVFGEAFCNMSLLSRQD